MIILVQKQKFKDNKKKKKGPTYLSLMENLYRLNDFAILIFSKKIQIQ